MNKGLWLVLGLAVAAGAAPGDGERRDRELDRSSQKVAEEQAEDFQDWADKKIDALRAEFNDLDKRLDKYTVQTRESARERVTELKERLAKLEGRLETIGDEADKKAWETREKIRDEIHGVRKDLDKMERKLEKKK